MRHKTIIAGMSVFTNKATRTLLALAVVAMWALPFSLIKVGMAEFGVPSGDIGGEALFAGVRFLAAGIALLVFAKATGHDFTVKGADAWGLMCLFGLVNIGLHYLFFYMGVGVSSGGRSSVVYSCSTFILIALSCAVFPDDKMTARKALGCVLGFIGISLVNLDFSHADQIFAGISLEGDGILLIAAVTSACGGLLTRFVTRRVDAFVATGFSLFFGGALLIIFGFTFGGSMPCITPLGVGVLIILIAVSAAAFAIYNTLLSVNPVSSIAIFNSGIPVLGLIFAVFILAEPFKIEYILAALVVATGVVLVNTQGRGKRD